MRSADIDAALALTAGEPVTEQAASTSATPSTPSTASTAVSERLMADALRSSAGVPSRAERDARQRSERALAIAAKQRLIRAAIERRNIEPKLLAAVQRHQTPCALLLGPTGCGKTSTALWIMAAHACHLVRSRDLATASRRHGLGDGYPPEVERARARGLCVIDDVGSEGSDVATLQDVLDHRYGRGYPTIVTTGLTDAGLRAHLGAAHYRRIVDQHVLRPDGSEFPVLIVDCHEEDGQ